MDKNKWLNIIGIFFIILGLVSISRIFWGVWQNVFWWCDHAVLIMGIAVLLRNKFWLTAELNIALIPQFLWSLDFFSKLIFDKFIFGFTAYMFDGGVIFKLLSYQHLFVFILAFIALFLLGKPPKFAWLGSLAHGTILFISGLLIPLEYNINCVHKNCLGFQTPYPFLFWFFCFFVMVFLTNYLLYKFIPLRK